MTVQTGKSMVRQTQQGVLCKAFELEGGLWFRLGCKGRWPWSGDGNPWSRSKTLREGPGGCESKVGVTSGAGGFRRAPSREAWLAVTRSLDFILTVAKTQVNFESQGVI